MFPLKALLVFEAVARHRSFTKAAHELMVSQSAVSHQIHNIESYFGVQLLDRSSGKVSLTSEGQMLYQDLDTAVSMLHVAVSNLKAALCSTPIGVSVRPHFAYKWLSPRLRDANFQFDICFYHTITRAEFSDSTIYLSIEWLHEDEVPEHAWLLVPGNLTPACHPTMLQGISNRSDPFILERYTLLHETDDTTWREWLAQAGVPKLQARRNIYYSDTNVRQQAAIDKLGFALVCPELIMVEIEEGCLICPFDVYLKTYGYYLIIPPERMSRPNVRQFVDFILNRAGPMKGSQ